MKEKTLEEITGIGAKFEDVVETGKVLLGKRSIEVDKEGVEKRVYEGIFAKVEEDTLYIATDGVYLCCQPGLSYIIPQLEKFPEYHGKKTIFLVTAYGGSEKEIFAERPKEVDYFTKLAKLELEKRCYPYGEERGLVGFIPVLKEELKAETLDLIHMDGIIEDRIFANYGRSKPMYSKDMVDVLIKL